MTELAPGTVVNRTYELKSPLGKGGFGSVWRATDLRSGGPVAIKFLHATGADALQRFQREVRALSRLKHPHCVTFLEAGQAPDGAPFLVSELVDGVTLQTWAAQRARGPDEVAEVGRQVARALAAAHAVGITHRDLKPDNVLVVGSDRPHVKVLDFGLAKLADEQGDVTKTGEVYGTPGFMSPEQLRGLRGVGPATDLYCLGVILYELLEGRPPFAGSSSLEISMKHLAQPVPPLSTAVPGWLTELVMGLLEKDVARRVGPADHVVKVLGRHGSAVPRWALPAGLTAAAAVALLVGASFVLTGDRDPPPARQTAERAIGRPGKISFGQEPSRAPATTETKEPARPAGCGRTHRTGLQQLDVGGRATWVYVPQTYDPAVAHPVVVMFHEHDQTPTELFAEMRFEGEADRHGLILVAPEDPDNLLPDTWENLDHARDAWRAARRLDKTLCVDPERYFAFGHAEGGWAAEQVACSGGRVAGVVTDSFRFRPDQECSAGPTPTLLITPLLNANAPVQGVTEDDFRAVPWESKLRVSLDEHQRRLAYRNGCSLERTISLGIGKHRCYDYVGCEAPLRACDVDAVRHWPGGTYPRWKVPQTDFPYQKVVGDFLSTARPGPADASVGDGQR